MCPTIACTSSSRAEEAALEREHVVGAAALRGGLDVRQQRGERLALVARDLAEEEVHPLDRRGALVERVDLGVADVLLDRVVLREAGAAEDLQRAGEQLVGLLRDRKSTRLNSSHGYISYAVFCLKKKKQTTRSI